MYFIANWKMYGNLSSINTVKNVINLSKKTKFKKIKIIYCPPYTLLRPLIKKLRKSKIQVGAQNCHTDNEFGAYTGSVNAKMIKSVGGKFVIIGHSENRLEGDTNKKINLKIKSSLKENLKVIFCIGENLKEKRNKKTNKILKSQIINGLKNVKNLNNIIVAYEPIWAIGTGIIPKLNDLDKQAKTIKKILNKRFKSKNPKVLYGGSVNSKNISDLTQISSIDGFLIGGASQKSKNFIDIIKKTIN
ncbi:triose-phosphate isomerase [Candidatus Pelagibacter sp.]|nr:triose-phosphate isomerase [Candidatus Pelagibacter sp.]